jgi:hypothetical protein
MGGRPDGSRNDDLNELVEHLQELESRVRALERVAGLAREGAAYPQGLLEGHAGATALSSMPVVMPVLGRALLAIAGAYLLRAIAESGTVPQVAAVIAALVYAGLWLFSSTRFRVSERFTTSAYAVTAAVIIAPLLWEATMRFHVLPAAATATVLVIFVTAGAALAWARNLAVVTWITTLAGVATALALIIATHALVPFTAALLGMAIVTEYSACRNHLLGERWVVALTANFSVFVMSYVATRPQGIPYGYPPMSAAAVLGLEMALLSIYLGSTVFRTLVHELPITWFEVGQAVIAFLIAISGALQLTRGAAGGTAVLGAFCLVSGAACYVVAFAIASHQSRRRNFYAYGTFGLALVVAGTTILLPAALTWSVVAVGAMWLGRRTGSMTLRAHAPVYLTLAAVVSGLIGYATSAMIGRTLPGQPEAAVVVATVAAALCYALAGNEQTTLARTSAMIVAGIGCWAVLGLAAAALSVIAPATVVRSILLCALAFTLPWGAARFQRRELLWLLYPLAGFAVLKLFAEDLSHGRPATLAISLLCYGATLVLLPHRMRSARAAVPERVTATVA